MAKKITAQAKRSRIRKNIPIPQFRNDAKNVELISKMNIGDCVVVADRAAANSLFVAARRVGKIKLLSRTSDGSINVWRIK